MVTIKDFKALRPKNNFAKDVAALPYDVYSTKEAAEEIKNTLAPFCRWICLPPRRRHSTGP